MPRVDSRRSASAVVPPATGAAPSTSCGTGAAVRIDGRSPADRDAAHRANVANRRATSAPSRRSCPGFVEEARRADARGAPRPRPTHGAAAPRDRDLTGASARTWTRWGATSRTHPRRARRDRVHSRSARGARRVTAGGPGGVLRRLGEPRRPQGLARGLAHGRQGHDRCSAARRVSVGARAGDGWCSRAASPRRGSPSASRAIGSSRWSSAAVPPTRGSTAGRRAGARPRGASSGTEPRSPQGATRGVRMQFLDRETARRALSHED